MIYIYSILITNANLRAVICSVATTPRPKDVIACSMIFIVLTRWHLPGNVWQRTKLETSLRADQATHSSHSATNCCCSVVVCGTTDQRSGCTSTITSISTTLSTVIGNAQRHAAMCQCAPSPAPRDWATITCSCSAVSLPRTIGPPMSCLCSTLVRSSRARGLFCRWLTSHSVQWAWRGKISIAMIDLCAATWPRCHSSDHVSIPWPIRTALIDSLTRHDHIIFCLVVIMEDPSMTVWFSWSTNEFRIRPMRSPLYTTAQLQSCKYKYFCKYL